MRRYLSTLVLVIGLATNAAHAQAFDPQDVRLFDPTQGELPESVTLDLQGNAYISMGNTIRKLTPDGQLSVFGTLPISAFALGVKVGPDDCVYAASTSLDPQIVGAFVWRICSQGVVEQFVALDPSGGPNDLAFDKAGNLYVTDPRLGVIWKVTSDQQVSVWLDHPALKGDPTAPVLPLGPLGVDGIAFDKHQRNLYVGNLDRGAIIKVALSSDGNPASVEEFVSSSLLKGADGLAFDNHGTLYVAVGAQDRIVAVAPNGCLAVVAEGGLLDGPSSLAFGTKGADKHTLYITSLALSRAFGYQPGIPRPALQRAQVPIKGLPLQR